MAVRKAADGSILCIPHMPLLPPNCLVVNSFAILQADGSSAPAPMNLLVSGTLQVGQSIAPYGSAASTPTVAADDPMHAHVNAPAPYVPASSVAASATARLASSGNPAYAASSVWYDVSSQAAASASAAPSSPSASLARVQMISQTAQAALAAVAGQSSIPTLSGTAAAHSNSVFQQPGSDAAVPAQPGLQGMVGAVTTMDVSKPLLQPAHSWGIITTEVASPMLQRTQHVYVSQAHKPVHPEEQVHAFTQAGEGSNLDNAVHTEAWQREEAEEQRTQAAWSSVQAVHLASTLPQPQAPLQISTNPTPIQVS